MNRFLRLFVISSLCVALLGGCSLTDGSSGSLELPPSGSIAFVNASPSSADVNIYFNEDKVNVEPFKFKDYFNYFTTAEGDKKFKITLVGSTVALSDTTIRVVQNKAYTVYVVDKPGTTTVKTLFLEDTGLLTDKANTMIRLIHLSPDTPAVNITLAGVAPSIGTGLTYQHASNYVEFPTASYTAEIRRVSDNALLLQVALPALLPGSYQTMLFVGYTTPPVGNTNTLSATVIR
ncbi:MAG: DUF4397 domain-containing protein [Cyclobacteriaceae bacterium]|nr:DUF4397 domain-containing protein [Cyclobacteriaceae bacterium]